MSPPTTGPPDTVSAGPGPSPPDRPSFRMYLTVASWMNGAIVSSAPAIATET